MINFLTNNLLEISFVVSLFINAIFLYLVLKYDVLRKERKYRAIKLTKKVIKEMTGIELKSDDVEYIVDRIKDIEREQLASIDSKMKNIEKSEHLKEILENYFDKKGLSYKKRFINFIAEIMVNFVKKYGVLNR